MDPHGTCQEGSDPETGHGHPPSVDTGKPWEDQHLEHGCFLSHGGTPKTLDGKFQGKPIYKWMITEGTFLFRKPPHCYPATAAFNLDDRALPHTVEMTGTHFSWTCSSYYHDSYSYSSDFSYLVASRVWALVNT